MENIEKRMNAYFDWLKENYKYKKMGQSIEIMTPFENHLNDTIRIYLDELPNGQLLLSDDGLTLNELDMYGINLDAIQFKHALNDILNSYGLTIKNEEIITTFKNDRFPQAKHNLIQAILKIYDLINTKIPNRYSPFVDDVYNFLFEKDIIGSDHISISGESGLYYSIDYILPPSKLKPEILLNFSNQLDFNKIASYAFSFRDVKQNRQSRNAIPIKMGIIVNDIENPICDSVLQGAKYENIQLFNWSDKENLVLSLQKGLNS